MKFPNHRIVDAHAHLCDPVFDTDRPAVIKRARAAGVGAIIAVGENLSDAKRNIELAANHPELKPAAGLYPTHLDLNKAKEMISFIRNERNKLVAIGEVGLDYWAVKEESEKGLQREIFISFVHLALELDLPLNVHSRSAGRHAVAVSVFLKQINMVTISSYLVMSSACALCPAILFPLVKKTFYAGLLFRMMSPCLIKKVSFDKRLKDYPYLRSRFETILEIIEAKAGSLNKAR